MTIYTIKLANMDVPKPLNEHPADGVIYWHLKFIDTLSQWVATFDNWKGRTCDEARFEFGIWKSGEQTQKAADAFNAYNRNVFKTSSDDSPSLLNPKIAPTPVL